MRWCRNAAPAGRPAGHQGHPRYRVVGLHPNPWLPSDDALWYGNAHLERLDTGRRHRTSMLVLRDQYVIVSLPVDQLLL